MQILDEDMQMVRNALAGAPEYVKGHFENLVSEHAKEAGDAADLRERVESLEQEEDAEIGKLQGECKALQDRLDDIEGDGMAGALETVKYWLHDFSYFHRMTHSAQEICAIVERALG